MSDFDDWYPSCVVKLTIRYDESLNIARPRDEITLDALSSQTVEARIVGQNQTTTPTGQRALGTGNHRSRRALEAVLPDQRQPTTALLPGVGPVAQRSSGGIPTSEIEPLTFGTDGFTVIANRVPKKGSFALPHPRTAPTFTLTFDYSEFPIDSEIIRGVGVEIHLGAVSGDDFARGMRGEVDEDGRPLSILKTTDDITDPFTGRKQVNAGTLLFYGTCDTLDTEHSDGGSIIVFEGREIRHILIDTKIDPARVDKVNLGQPIAAVIGDLIGTVPFENGFRLTVATDATEWPDGIVPSPGDAEGLTRVRIKASARPNAKTKAKLASGGDPGVQTGDKASSRASSDNGGKTSYWDLITNYCELVGGMPYIVGSMLWVRPVHRIFDIADPRSKIATPFAGGNPRQAGDEQIRIRRLVLGRDIKRIRKQRKFGGVAIVPTVQTISFDDRVAGGQRLIFGQWPPSGSDSAEAKAEGELLRVPMWGVRSVDRLTQIARGIYEEVGRGETGGTAETSKLASFGGDNADPDLLRLRPLEPIEFVVDTKARRAALPIAADVNELEGMTFSEEVERLHQTLGDLALARALVALSRGAVLETLRFHQVVGVQYEWDKGVKTTITFQNYIVPRHFEAAVSDRRPQKDIQTKAVKAVGGGRKARAKPRVRVEFSDFQRVDKQVTPVEKPKRQRTYIDAQGLTAQDRGSRGLQ